MERLPVLGIYIKKMNFPISICIFTPDQKNFRWRNGESTACPERILHSNSKNLPKIFFYFIEFDAVIDFLLSASKEATKSINTIITDRTSAQIMSFILHRCNLSPLVFSNIVFFNRTQSLLSRKASQNKHSSFADCNSMGISTFVHLSFVQDFIFLSQVNSRVFFRRRASPSNKNLSWTKGNWCRALIKFMTSVIRKFFNGPFIFIHIVAKTDFGIDIISKQIYVSLISRTSIQRWKFE